MTKKTNTSKFYFAPEGKMYEINRENILTLFGGQRALLMQLAHPLVSQGVMDHSSVRVDPLKRLNRTIQLSQTLIFGTKEEVAQAAEKINRVHKAVKGNLAQTTGVHQSGAAYRAHDPALLLWVWVTLTDTAVIVYDTFIRKLSAKEKEAYYQESKRVLPPLGGTIESTPATYKDMQQYIKDLIANKTVHVNDDVKKEIIPYLLLRKPKRVRFPLIAVSRPITRITTCMLPVEIREQYGLSWKPRNQKLFDILSATSRRFYQSRLSYLIPDVVRFSPYYRRAVRQM